MQPIASPCKVLFIFLLVNLFQVCPVTGCSCRCASLDANSDMQRDIRHLIAWHCTVPYTELFLVCHNVLQSIFGEFKFYLVWLSTAPFRKSQNEKQNGCRHVALSTNIHSVCHKASFFFIGVNHLCDKIFLKFLLFFIFSERGMNSFQMIDSTIKWSIKKTFKECLVGKK